MFLASTISFSTEVQTTTTINTAELIDIPEDCPQKSYSFNQLNPVGKTFTYSPGKAQTFSIDPFYSFTTNCGPALTLTYADDSSNVSPFTASPSFISVRTSDGQIAVTISSTAVTSSVWIKGTLSTAPSQTTSVVQFIIKGVTGYNAPPYFDPGLTDQYVQIKQSSLPIILSGLRDPEGAKVSIVSCSQPNGTSLPNFIKCCKVSSLLCTTIPSITINPQVMNDRGMTPVEIVVADQDSSNTASYQFNVIVYNKAPILLEDPPTDVYFDFNKEQIMTLPKTKDQEKLNYYTKIAKGPTNFLSVLSNSQLKISPLNCLTDVGTHLVQIQVYDEQPLSITYNFYMHINNLPPFQYKNIPDQKVKLRQTLSLSIEDYFSDPEGCTPLTIELDQSLSFIDQYQQGKMVFKPSQIFQAGSYELKMIATDYQGLQQESNSFKLIVYDAPRFLGPIIKKQFLAVNSISYYPLPVDLSESDQFITNLKIPSFATFNYPTFIFIPHTRKSIGLNQISGSLCNPYACKNFTFNLFVTNTPPEFAGIEDFLIPPHEVSATQTNSSYLLPIIIDLENPKTYIVTFSPPLPPFIAYIKELNTIEISPQAGDVGSHTFMITLTDSFGASSNKYTFQLLVNKYDKQSIIPLPRDTNYTQDNVTFKLESVMRTGEAQIRLFSQTNRSGEIISVITPQTFSIEMLNQTNNSVCYEIVQRDKRKGTLVIKMKFNYSSKVSKGYELDIIKVLVVQEIKIRKKLDVLQLLEGTKFFTSVPPQTSTDFEKSIVQFFKKGRFNFTKHKLINFILALLIQSIWSQLEDLSFLIILSIISMNIPGMALVIQNTMLNLLYYDLLFTEEWMPELWDLFGLDYDSVDDNPLNGYFQENGFESTLFIKNIGSTLIFVSAVINYTYLGLFISQKKVGSVRL